MAYRSESILLVSMYILYVHKYTHIYIHYKNTHAHANIYALRNSCPGSATVIPCLAFQKLRNLSIGFKNRPQEYWLGIARAAAEIDDCLNFAICSFKQVLCQYSLAPWSSSSRIGLWQPQPGRSLAHLAVHFWNPMPRFLSF